MSISSPNHVWGGARAVLLVASLIATLLTGVLTPFSPAPAEAAGSEPLRFDDPDNYVLASNEAPLAFLGLGEQNAWWTALSDQAAAGARFGLDKARYEEQDPSLDVFYEALLTSAQYPVESAFDSHDAEIIGSVAGYVHDGSVGDDREIVVATVDTTGTVRVFGPQIDGYPTVDTIQLDTTEGFTFSAADFRGMVLVNQDDRQDAATTLIVGGPETLYNIQMNLDTTGDLVVLPAIGFPAFGGRLLAIAHRPFWDLEYDQIAPPVARTSDYFYAVESVTATDDQKARPRIVKQTVNGALEFVTGEFQGQNALKFDIGSTDDGRNFDLNYDYYETNPAAGDPNERILMAWRGPSKPDTSTSRRGFLLGASINNAGAFSASNWGGGDYACAGDMDFRAYQNTNTSGIGNFPTWTMLCGNEDGGSVAVGRTTGNDLNSSVFGDAVTGSMSQLPGGQSHNDPQVHLSYPCLELFRTTGVLRADTFIGDQCTGVAFTVDDAGTDDDITDDIRTVTNPGDVAITIISGVAGTGSGSRARADDVVIDHALVQNIPGLAVVNEWGERSLPVTDDGDQQHTLVQLPFDEIRTVVDLDEEYDSCKIGSPEECAPPQQLSDPIPLAILAAPPQVANANQTTFDPPIYATAQSVGGSTGNSVGGSVSVYGGINTGEKLVGGEVQITAGYGFAFGATTGGSIEVTQTQAFTGLEDDDSVVFQSKNSYVYTGTITESTNGLVTGDDFRFAIPISVGRNVTSWGNLQTLEPASFGPTGGTGGAPGVFYESIEAVLDHNVGDPGSYPGFGNDTDADAGAELDERCLGSLDGLEEEFAALGKFDVASLNIFGDAANRLPSPEDAILTTEAFQTIAGSLNGVGAEIEITRTDDSSYNFEAEISLAVDALVGGAGVNAAFGGEASIAFGTETSFSLGESTAFSASVGHFPSEELDNEVYAWRMYLCRQDLQAVGGLPLPFPVHVLGFTVDNYAGSGGIEDLADIDLLNGTGSETLPRRPLLEYEQLSGTVKTYQIDVEAIGAVDRFSSTVTYDSTVTGGTNPSNATSRSTQLSIDPLADRGIDAQLLPGQLYRWRVTSTDFFDNVVQSDYEFFVTEGPPTSSFTYAPTAPVVSEDVTFTAAEQPDSTYAWDFGNGDTSTDRVATTSYDQAGPATVVLTVTNDRGSDETSQVVRVGVTSGDDTYDAIEDTELVVVAPGLLTNDDGATTASLVSDATDGNLRLGADGRFRYTPDPDVCGADSFTYLPSGGGVAGTSAAVVTINVACVNDAPRALGNDDVITPEGVPVTVAAPGVLADDTDVDGDALTAVLVEDSPDGPVTLAADGSWSFTSADENFCGTTSFSYAAFDGLLQSTPSLVVITVTCVDDAPVAPDEDPTASGDEDEPVEGTVPADDPDGDTLTFTLVDEPDNGVVDLDEATGAYTYTPNLNFCGTDRFVVQISDGNSSVLVPVTIEIACVDDPPPTIPSVSDDPDSTPVFVTVPGEPIMVQLPGDAENPDGDETLVINLVGAPLSGTTVIQSGVLVYTPAPGDCGPVDIEYEISDGVGPPVTQTVTIDVTCVLGAVELASIRVLGGPVALEAEIDDELTELTGRRTARLSGDDRYATADAVVRDGWSSGASTIYITTGRNFPDSLAAGAAAAKDGAPVVLVDGGQDDEVPSELLVDLGADRIVIVGGKGAISSALAERIDTVTGLVSTRVAGDDRYDTAAQLALQGWEDGAELVYIATGEDFPDALAGAAAAGELGAPILLTKQDELPAATLAALLELEPERIVVLGGEVAVDDAVLITIRAKLGTAPRRIAGQDRYETAALVVEDTWPDGAPTAFVATGRGFPDALAGAASAARRRSPIVLTERRQLPDFTRRELSRVLTKL